MLAGENSREVSHRAVEKLAAIGAHLPEGVKLTVLYDRSDLVGATIRTVETNLFEGALIVMHFTEKRTASKATDEESEAPVSEE